MSKLIPSRFFSSQARNPTGVIGRYVMTRIFNKGNADLNSFVKEMLDIKKTDRILEIGFGSGKLINEMAEINTEGVVEGVDFSAAMLKVARKVNKRLILDGKVILQRGECGSLPFDNESFDKLCAVNILYFWKEPGKYFTEMFRVLKPEGKIVIGFRDQRQMGRLNLNEDIFSRYSLDEVITLLSTAWFSGSHIEEKESKPFLSYCAVATKA
jgi:ubiquinone/menaquinone biosynthesis C-methylase UbiE